MAFIACIFSYAVFDYTKYFYNMPEDIFAAVTLNSETGENNVFTWQLVRELDKKTEFIDTKHKVLLIGDSQSGDFINSLNEAGLNHNVDVVSRIIQSRCEVFHLGKNSLHESFKANENLVDRGMKIKCEEQVERLVTDGIVEQANIIIVSMLWKNRSMPFAIESIQGIRKRNKNAKIYIVSVKSFNKPVPKIIYEAYDKKINIESYAFDEISNNEEVRSSFQYDAFIKHKDTINFTFINSMDFFCDAGKCSILNGNNIPLYYDRTHVTRTGAKHMGLAIKRRAIFPADFFSSFPHKK